MAKEQESAENQLLKIIETESSSEESKTPGAKKKFQFKGVGKLMGIRTVNKLLIVGLLALGYLLVMAFIDGINLSKREMKFSVGKNISSFKEYVLTPTENLDEYQSQIEARNIFKPFVEKVEIVEEVVESKVDNLAESLKIVGISWFNETPGSASVMIEDVDTGITHFLLEGEEIKDLTVKTIYADRAILSYQDEEIPLKL